MSGGVGIGELDPRNAADHVGAERHGLMHQVRGARLAHDAVLCEGDDLNIDHAAKLVAHADERLDAFKPRLAVDVGEGADVEVAIHGRQRDGAARIIDDPGLGVFLLDLAGKLDAGHRLAHAIGLIGLERFLLHHRQRPDLAEMQVRIDEGLRHQIAARIDFGCGLAIEPRERSPRCGRP